MGISGTTITSTHSATITKPIPSSSEEGTAPTPVEEEEPTTPDWEEVTVGDIIPIIPSESDDYTFSVLHMLPCTADKVPLLLEQSTPANFYSYMTNGTTYTYEGKDQFIPYSGNHTGIGYKEDTSYTYACSFTDVGLYVLIFYGNKTSALDNVIYENNAEKVEQGISEFYKYVYFKVKPAESDLTTPNFAKLELTDEELDRLGDGYPYILQSNLQLNTEETYVRNWYKNFRIGVFNNRIEANCTTYYQYDNTETEFDGYFILPGIYDLTDAQLRFDVDHPISLTILEDTYDITSTETIDLFEEYRIPVTFTKDTNNVIITITLIDSTNQEVYSVDYHINFQATETTDIQELIDDSTDYSNLTDEQIFTNAKWWSTQTAGLNTSNNVECDFTYEEDYPLYILITGDYPEGDPENNTITFNEPCIVEEEQYNGRTPNGNYPEPIDDLVLNDGSTSEVTMDSYTKSETIVFYDLPLTDNYGTNTEMAIRGIELTGNVEQSDRVTLYAKLQSPNGESRERSIVLDDNETSLDTDNSFSIGGNGDLWGFSTLDIVNLEDWEIELTATNTLEETTANLNYGDIQLNLYIEQVTTQNITCYINGEDIRYYGVFLTDIKIPEGLQTDTKYLDIDGTDTNDAYRQNIREKTITIEFDLGNDCDINANTQSLREFTKLLVNDRDEYNRPIPKRIEFSHYPDVYWEYIMEEALDHKLEIGSYIDGKVKLTIPAGTSYDKESTTTSNTGYVNGIATIHPNIIFKPTDTVVTIRETVTGQEFHIGYTGGWNDKIVEIDCDNRIAWLKTNEDDIDPVNLNKYVDYNSDWFRLKGEYSFTGVNCIIRTVDYSERW